MLMTAVEADDVGAVEAPLSEGDVVALMLEVMADGLDHPELWALVDDFVADQPALAAEVDRRLARADDPLIRARLLIILALCGAAGGDAAAMHAAFAPVAADFSQDPQVQGAWFHLAGRAWPDDPRYHLQGKLCPTPFEQLDVLEASSHLCCASWLHQSAGDLRTEDWREVWNGAAAQAIRASIHDGSYRYCNKGACPRIQANELIPTAELAARSPVWARIVEGRETAVDQGPETVNLSYDRTCNLSCPSCRTEKIAAGPEERATFARMQEANILPLLRTTKLAFITGSGDPFASKTFRALLDRLTPDAYPDLRFQLMTNAMLLNPAAWARFPALHRRVALIKVSIDAATGRTHELLRRGARWETMLANMRFIGGLAARGEVDAYELVFTVQRDNYREMGEAVDLAKAVGATGIYFARLTNWGTFTPDAYRERAVFNPAHPEHAAFLAAMQDDRLKDAMVLLGDLRPFVDGDCGERRFVR